MRPPVEAHEKIFDVVHHVHGYEEELAVSRGRARASASTDPDFKLALRDFVIDGLETEDGTYRGGPIVGSGKFMPEFTSAKSDPETSQGGHPNVHYTVGAAGIVIEVDRETGKMQVKKAALAVDVGKAINPNLIEGQITGGSLQGLATVLYEDMRFDDKGRS